MASFNAVRALTFFTFKKPAVPHQIDLLEEAAKK